MRKSGAKGARMAQLQTYEASSPDLLRRFNVISNTISENFRAPWEAQPVGSTSRPARFNWACAEGVDYSHAEMPALRLTNRSSGSVRAPKFHVFSCDQSLLIKIYLFHRNSNTYSCRRLKKQRRQRWQFHKESS